MAMLVITRPGIHGIHLSTEVDATFTLWRTLDLIAAVRPPPGSEEWNMGSTPWTKKTTNFSV